MRSISSSKVQSLTRWWRLRKRRNSQQSLVCCSTDMKYTKMFFLQWIARNMSVRLVKYWNKKRQKRKRRKRKGRRNCWGRREGGRKRSSLMLIRSSKKSWKPSKGTIQSGRETGVSQSQVVLRGTTTSQTTWLWRVVSQNWNFKLKIKSISDAIQSHEQVLQIFLRVRGSILKIRSRFQLKVAELKGIS